MKPLRSVCTPLDGAQAVRGTPPMQRNIAETGSVSGAEPRGTRWVTAPSWPACSCTAVTGLRSLHLDPSLRLDPLDEVGGHRLGEAVAPDDLCDAPRPALARFITAWPAELPAPTTITSLSGALDGLAAPRAVVHPVPEQFLHAVELEPAPFHPRRDDHDVGGSPRRRSKAPPIGVSPGARWPRTTPLRIRSSAPKRSAWRPASRESSAPADGVDEAEEVLDRGRVAVAWPPGTSASATAVDSPSDAPYTAAARPAGPAPTMKRS